jgi:hypothetical protein
LFACFGLHCIDAKPETAKHVLKVPYAMCGLLIDRRGNEGMEQFASATEAQEQNDYKQAATHYFAAAAAMASGARSEQTQYNRRVAYANGVNALLSAGAVVDARAALATITDPELALELKQASDALPSPMRCVPRRKR